MRVLVAARCFGLLGCGLLVGVARAEDDFRDLDARTQKALATTARAYLDPDVEFL